MNNLQGLLERFKALINSSKDIQTQIKEIIAREARIELEEGQIDIRDATLFVKVSPAMKNSLFMYKKKILEALQKEMGTKAPKDMR